MTGKGFSETEFEGYRDEPPPSDTGVPNGQRSQSKALLKSSAAFIAELVPPDYVIDGVTM
jgi:hypothetical protein